MTGAATISTDSGGDLLAGHRLGFACVVLGRPGLKAHDARRWQNEPHLRVSIGYLHAIFDYLNDTDIRMYRLSSGVAPYITHRDLPQFWNQIEECQTELVELGAKARRYGLRLSSHPGQYSLLNAQDDQVYQDSLRDFDYHVALLDAMGMPDDNKVITHVGGVYGDKEASRARFAERYPRLPERVRARLILENDETHYDLTDVLWIQSRTGIPVCWDWLHHAVNNPAAIPADEATRLAIATWPDNQRPKIHYSSQRREPRMVARKNRKTGERVMVEAKAAVGQHADDIDAGEFAAYLASVQGLAFDIMLEAKNKDLALLKLRADLAARHAPPAHARPATEGPEAGA
jgi:UV DNA damage endonuclease